MPLNETSHENILRAPLDSSRISKVRKGFLVIGIQEIVPSADIGLLSELNSRNFLLDTIVKTLLSPNAFQKYLPSWSLVLVCFR